MRSILNALLGALLGALTGFLAGIWVGGRVRPRKQSFRPSERLRELRKEFTYQERVDNAEFIPTVVDSATFERLLSEDYPQTHGRNFG